MSNAKPDVAVGMDWTGLLTDPDLARNLGKLLQTYRDAPPEGREEALLAAIREVKKDSSGASSPPTSTKVAKETPAQALPKAVSAPPPFEPDIFSPNWGQDRRRHPRIRCFVAVELRVNDADAPIWGNLSNTSMGGCQVETAVHVKRRLQSRNRTLGRKWQDLGERLGIERDSHSRRACCGNAYPLRWNGSRRKRESPSVSQVCPGDDAELRTAKTVTCNC